MRGGRASGTTDRRISQTPTHRCHADHQSQRPAATVRRQAGQT